MDMTNVSAVRCIMVMVILLPVGCSIFQPAGQEKVQPETPVPLATKQALDSPEDVRPLPPPKVKYLNHKVKWPGENLILIASWYTGSAKNWMRLAKANPGIEPRRIKIGDSILIPEDLLKTRQPMPIEFLSSATSPKKEPPSPSAKQAGSSDKIDLFGPIDTEAPTRDADHIDSPLPLETIE
jgi:hypothetical protein